MLDTVHTAATEADHLIARVESRMTGLLDGSDAARTHLSAGGQRLRARLALSAAAKLRLPDEVAVTLATVAELLHNASLVHDDIQDGDATRRGAPAIWARYGVPVAICAGDLMLSAAYGALADAPPRHLPSLLSRVHAQVAATVRGQGVDLTAGAVTAAAYAGIAAAKSGALLGLPLELCLTVAGEDSAAAAAAAAAFAVGYQIADDLDDVAADVASGAPNAVAILGGVVPARVVARDHLARAATLAARLPQGCGGLLAEMAARLSARLSAQP